MKIMGWVVHKRRLIWKFARKKIVCKGTFMDRFYIRP